MKIYKCKKCGKLVIETTELSTIPSCCGESMQQLEANTVDASVEKHVPVCEKEKDMLKVTVGEVLHPMTEEHFIMWILLEEKNGYSIKYLKPQEEPFVSFSDTEWVSVYAYCNLHGLWKIEK